MAAPLQDLPVELIERIVTSLTTPEVGFLRLSCSELRDKASQGSYLRLFTHRSVDLTETGLNAVLTALTKTGGLARRLRHLHLIAVRYDPKAGEQHHPTFGHAWVPPSQVRLHKSACPSQRKPSAGEKRHVNRVDQAAFRLLRAQHRWNVESGLYAGLLARVFEAVKGVCGDGGLEALGLGVMVQTGLHQRFTPDALDQRCTASEESFLLATTLDALAASKLAARHFDVFSQSRLCSVGSTELAAYLSKSPPPSIRSFGPQVTSLALSYSRMTTDSTLNSCCSCNSRKFWHADDPSTCHAHRTPFADEGESHCEHETSIGTFLSFFPSLTTLVLHEFETEYRYDSSIEHPTSLFAHLASTLHLPALRTCTLRGTNLNEQALITFLKRLPQLEKLTLEHINLAEGSWTPIFTHLTSATLPSLSSLVLRDLFEHKTPTSNPNAPPPPIPPPPPPLPPGVGGAFNPHFIPSPSATTDSYLPSLLAFRPQGVPKGEMVLGGCFGNNRVEVRGMWVRKLELVYGFMGLVGAGDGKRARAEARWEREGGREFGPSCGDPFGDL